MCRSLTVHDLDTIMQVVPSRCRPVHVGGVWGRTNGLAADAAVGPNLHELAQSHDVLLCLPRQLACGTQHQRLNPASPRSPHGEQLTHSSNTHTANSTAVSLTSRSRPGRCNHPESTNLHHMDAIARSRRKRYMHAGGAYWFLEVSRFWQRARAIMDVFPVPDCACAITSLPAPEQPNDMWSSLLYIYLRLCRDSRIVHDDFCTSSCTGGLTACDHACCHSGSDCIGECPESAQTPNLHKLDYVTCQVNAD